MMRKRMSTMMILCGALALGLSACSTGSTAGSAAETTQAGTAQAEAVSANAAAATLAEAAGTEETAAAGEADSGNADTENAVAENADAEKENLPGESGEISKVAEQNAEGGSNSEDGFGGPRGKDGGPGGGFGGPGGNGGGPGGPNGGGGRNGGGMQTAVDPEIAAVLEANADRFTQLTFEDPETGISLEYSLYVPEDYDASGSYPMIMFIPDASSSGKSAREIVEQYYGSVVWVTDEEQAKHPSFVLVPAFTETVVDDNWNTSDQIETAVRLMEALTEEYSIDPNRLYTTGQSMGCMTSLYLNSRYPELFAASLFVSGQWDIDVLKPLEEARFFYITAGGDAKASGGQTEVMEMLDADGIGYSYGTWSARESEEEQSANAEELIAEGHQANMIRFETGTVLSGEGGGQEHMASFNYGYRIEAVRDWIFEQSK